MHEEQNKTSEEIKSRQYLILSVAGLVVVALMGGLFYLMFDKAPTKQVENTQTVPFSSPMSQFDSKSVLMDRLQNELKEQKSEASKMKEALIAMQQAEKFKEENNQIEALRLQVETLQGALAARDNKIDGLPENAGNGGAIFPALPNESAPQFVPQAKGIDSIKINLKSKKDKPTKNPDTFVPAGTFAQAIMLGAADASAGVQSQANPSPMLFRLTADGTLPNKKTSHLKDCVVTAAVVGDISSERGQIRLERLSCTYPTGEIVEQPVEGTVFGMDAKNGVRGKPVWREGALLGRAAAAGTISGLGSAISQTFTSQSISPLGSVETVETGDIFKYSAAQGASNAMEKLADYNIRRAEQYHPVIQLSAGQEVDVVFLKGFFLDGKSHEEEAQTSAAPTQLFPNQAKQTSSGLTITEEELERINQYEKSIKGINTTRSGGVQ